MLRLRASRLLRTTNARRVCYLVISILCSAEYAPGNCIRIKQLTSRPLTGKPVSHAFAKELLAGFVGGEADKLVETKGEDFYDRERVRNQAQEVRYIPILLSLSLPHHVSTPYRTSILVGYKADFWVTIERHGHVRGALPAGLWRGPV